MIPWQSCQWPPLQRSCKFQVQAFPGNEVNEVRKSEQQNHPTPMTLHSSKGPTAKGSDKMAPVVPKESRHFLNHHFLGARLTFREGTLPAVGLFMYICIYV